jgi:hypothetical protein
VGCGSSDEGGGNTEGFVDLSLGCGPVLSETFTQISLTPPDNLDILFLTDTSESNDHPDQITHLANNIENLFSQFSSVPDYRVGVGLAHGGASAFSGELFTTFAGAGNGEPEVLKPGTADKETILFNKLTDNRADKEVPDTIPDTDDLDPNSDTLKTAYYGTDGGEAGLYSLKKMFDDNFYSIRTSTSDEFLRDDAGLLVFFVADENDICYPGNPQTVDWDTINIFDTITELFTRKSKEDWARDRWCDGVTASSVLASLKDKKGELPVNVSGLIHSDPNSIDSSESENGLSHGYLDLVSLTNGYSINFNSNEAEIAAGLTALGKHINKKLSLKTEFTMSDTDVAPRSVALFVDDVLVDSNFNAVTNNVQMMGQDAGIVGSDIRVEYRATCK